MELHEKYEYWLDIAQYDLETLCKGLYLLFIEDNIPKVHDINLLITKFEDKLPSAIEDDKRLLFAKLSAFYLNNRYPKYKERLSVSLNMEEALNILEQTREAFTWLKTLKP